MTGRLVPQTELTADQLSAMYRLHASHFRGVTEDQFCRDAMAKNWTILLERQGQMVGFSTLLAYETKVAGEIASVIYSGDTIVDPSAWGTSALPRLWIESVTRLREQYPRGAYYWLLIASGFRTYRFLPLFWKEFYPRNDLATPAIWQQRIDELSRERFGEAYQRTDGIVRFSQPQILREALGEITPARLNDPHIAFFAERDPGHLLGDELVCLTSLSDENLTRAGHRMLKPERH
jgi:hypothetical protein